MSFIYNKIFVPDFFSKLLDNNFNYYIDMSVLPKNRQLVFSILNYIRDTSEIFSISSLVKIFSKQSYQCNKKKITRWFEHVKFIFLWKKVS